MSEVGRIAQRAVQRAVAALLKSAQQRLPRDVRVEASGDAIVVSRRRLRVRSLSDARLRGIGR